MHQFFCKISQRFCKLHSKILVIIIQNKYKNFQFLQNFLKFLKNNLKMSKIFLNFLEIFSHAWRFIFSIIKQGSQAWTRDSMETSLAGPNASNHVRMIERANLFNKNPIGTPARV